MGRRLKATPGANVTRHKPKPVEVSNIAHPATWKQALKLAGGDKSRLKVLSQGRIEVLPSPRHRAD
jgi:hypothetical protein